MVLIETINNDFSTLDVIEWLKFYKVDYHIITPADIVSICLNQYDKTVEITIGEKSFSLNDISGYWYRRGLYEVNMKKSSPYYDVNDEMVISSYFHSTNEKNVILDYFHYLLNQKKTINSFLNPNVNKLAVLHKANEFGLKHPSHLLTNSKSDLETFFRKCKGKVITKVVSPSGGFDTKKHIISSYTELIDKKFLNNLNPTFPSSYFQECIDKYFEIRAFYLNEKFYSMAIFSQESKKTSVDFRKYDRDTPNRCIPYNLPTEIEKKLKLLFDSLNLNSGSADLILSKDSDYYFLEINPVGQFGMVSFPCNYYLEREIALYFKNSNYYE
ncbi:MAG: grasp-with-spasm system ATP-grasp peptide maturase [Bacteroidales bacterium]|nr:grasp-with-spasm system ATP-grasp peptide maturase [Bacteroidales bacterium]